MIEDMRTIKSVAPKEGAKIVDAKKAQATAISNPPKRATHVKIVGAVESGQGVEIVSQHKPAT